MKEIILNIKPGREFKVQIMVVVAGSGKLSRRQSILEEYKELIRETADDVRVNLLSGKVEDEDNFYMGYGEKIAKIAKKLKRAKIPSIDLRRETQVVLENPSDHHLPPSEIQSMVGIYEKLLGKTS